VVRGSAHTRLLWTITRNQSVWLRSPVRQDPRINRGGLRLTSAVYNQEISEPNSVSSLKYRFCAEPPVKSEICLASELVRDVQMTRFFDQIGAVFYNHYTHPEPASQVPLLWKLSPHPAYMLSFPRCREQDARPALTACSSSQIGSYS